MIGPRRPPGGRTGRRSMPGTYRVVAAILAPVVRALVRRSYRGLEHVPPEGPALVCVNHIGAFDPLCFALALWDNDTPALFLGKAGIVRAPVVGPILRSTGIVPVDRETSRADEAFGAAVTLLRRGRVIGQRAAAGRHAARPRPTASPTAAAARPAGTTRRPPHPGRPGHRVTSSAATSMSAPARPRPSPPRAEHRSRPARRSPASSSRATG